MARANGALSRPGWAEEHYRPGRSQPDTLRQLRMCKRSNDPALQEFFGCRETLYLRPQPSRREVATVALYDLKLLGHAMDADLM